MLGRIKNDNHTIRVIKSIQNHIKNKLPVGPESIIDIDGLKAYEFNFINQSLDKNYSIIINDDGSIFNVAYQDLKQ